MIFSDQHLKVWLYTQATDMRKSFKGLIALVKQQLDENPISGQLFVFINKRKIFMKILYYDQGGFCIWSKKLTQGQFALKHSEHKKQSLSWQELQWLIEGMEFDQVRYRKRFKIAS